MKQPLVLGLIAGSFAPGLALGLSSIMLLLIHPEPNTSFLLAFFGSIAVVLIFSVPALLFYVLPIFLLFKSLRIANIYMCLATAITPILVAGFIPNIASTVAQKAIFGALFVVSALAFWYFARQTIHTNEKHA